MDERMLCKPRDSRKIVLRKKRATFDWQTQQLLYSL